MKIAILANAQQKEEWLSKENVKEVQLTWVANEKELANANADAYFDLLFVPVDASIERYSTLKSPLFVHEVIHTFSSIIHDSAFAIPIFRLNAWPGFLKREMIEVASYKSEDQKIGELIFSTLGWKWKWVADIPGLITARVISTVVNEAYFTLEQAVSSKEEIDIAMKLGTNYPYGPFEWSEQIGLGNIYALLKELGKQDPKYLPCELMKRETEKSWH
jgi:3-hydroxybutyryl-CoA dehydrogenase